MTATLNDVTKKKPAEASAEQQAAAELVRLAKEQGLSLTGLRALEQLTKAVLENSRTRPRLRRRVGHRGRCITG